MKRPLILAVALLTALSAYALTAREAFVRIETPSLNLLTVQMRQDLLSYYDADTLRQVPNALGGLSQLTRPLTDDYLKVRITPVSTMAVKTIPNGQDTIVATIYTIAAPGQGADSQVTFYDSELRKLPTHRFLRLAQIDEFIETGRNREGREQKKRLLSLIPYPTVEYAFAPDGDTVTAHLTVTDYLGAETLQQLERHIRPHLTYVWNGHKYELQKK